MIIYQNKKGLLCLKLTLCDFILEVLSNEATENNRSIESEITTRLRATFYNDIEYRVRVTELAGSKIVSHGVKKHILTVDRNMMDLLVASAVVDNRSLDEEVSLRLMVSLVNPAEMELVNHSNALIRHHIINEEKERQRIAAMVMRARASQNKGA